MEERREKYGVCVAAMMRQSHEARSFGNCFHEFMVTLEKPWMWRIFTAGVKCHSILWYFLKSFTIPSWWHFYVYLGPYRVMLSIAVRRKIIITSYYRHTVRFSRVTTPYSRRTWVYKAVFHGQNFPYNPNIIPSMPFPTLLDQYKTINVV